MTRTAIPPDSIRAAMAEIRAALNVLPSLTAEPSDTPDLHISRHARYREAVARLARHLEGTLGARITDHHNAARVRLYGIAASSTSGIVGALQNWIAAADRRLAEMERTS